MLETNSNITDPGAFNEYVKEINTIQCFLTELKNNTNPIENNKYTKINSSINYISTVLFKHVELSYKKQILEKLQLFKNSLSEREEKVNSRINQKTFNWARTFFGGETAKLKEELGEIKKLEENLKDLIRIKGEVVEHIEQRFNFPVSERLNAVPSQKAINPPHPSKIIEKKPILQSEHDDPSIPPAPPLPAFPSAKLALAEKEKSKERIVAEKQPRPLDKIDAKVEIKEAIPAEGKAKEIGANQSSSEMLGQIRQGKPLKKANKQKGTKAEMAQQNSDKDGSFLKNEMAKRRFLITEDDDDKQEKEPLLQSKPSAFSPNPDSPPLSPPFPLAEPAPRENEMLQSSIPQKKAKKKENSVEPKRAENSPALLDQIKKGKKLKKVLPEEITHTQKILSNSPLADLLSKAIEKTSPPSQRNKGPDSEPKESDDDEWV